MTTEQMPIFSVVINYVFSHAVTDSGQCDYNFVQYPSSYYPSPEEIIIEYAVAIDAE